MTPTLWFKRKPVRSAGFLLLGSGCCSSCTTHSIWSRALSASSTPSCRIICGRRVSRRSRHSASTPIRCSVSLPESSRALYMLFKIRLAHPAILTQHHRLIWEGQVGKQIVAAAMMGQFHTNLLSSTKKQL